jgi:hypothetical protein
VPSWNPETTEERADASPPVVARVRELLAQLFSQRVPTPVDRHRQRPADARDERERGEE